MTKAVNIIFLFLVICSSLSCKSQNILKEQESIITEIKDSTLCNEQTILKYSLPYIATSNSSKNKSLNSVIASDVSDHLNWFDSFDNAKNLKQNLSLFIGKCQERCNEDSIVPFVGSYYEVGVYRANEILSLELFTEVYSGSMRAEEYTYNFDLKTGKEIVTSDIFKQNSKDLINVLNKRIRKAIYEDLEDEDNLNDLEKETIIKGKLLTDSPNWFFITQSEDDKSYGLDVFVNIDWKQSNISPSLRVYFSFNELKQYIKEDLKSIFNL